MKNKILIVEDNTEMRENITEILEISNYEVRGAEDGIKGIQLMKEFSPDLIISDVMMPNLDGLGMLKIMQQDEGLSKIPLIFLSAKTEKDDFRKGMNLGAEDYLVKPFESKDLLEVVEKKLEKYKKINSSSSVRRLKGTFNEEDLIHNAKIKLEIESSIESEMGKGTQLWKPGAPINTIYYLESGIVKEYIDSVAGKELVIKFYKGPITIGIDKLYQSKHSTYAETTEHCRIRPLLKSSFEEIVENENLLLSYHHYTSQLILDLQDRLSINSYGNVREKVCYHIYELHEYFKGQSIHLSREDLASYCGMAKETLIRMLSDLKDDKLIQLSPEGIKILNLNKLSAEF